MIKEILSIFISIKSNISLFIYSSEKNLFSNKLVVTHKIFNFPMEPEIKLFDFITDLIDIISFDENLILKFFIF